MKLLQFAESVFDPFRFNRYMLEPYLLKDEEKHPFALVCPGGGYSMVCSSGEGKPFAQKLNKLGYHAFVLRYRTGRKGRYPHPQQDVRRAVEEIFAYAEQWNIDTEGWSLWGSSAGGHLAASYCAEKWDAPKPSALILCYPVITMGEYTHKGSRDNLLGKKVKAEMIEKLSVEKNVSADYPPTYLWFGTADEAVPHVNGEMLKAALAEFSVECVTELYEGIGHGAGMATGTVAEPWFNNAVEFWEKHIGKSAIKPNEPIEVFMNSSEDKCGELYYKNGCFTYLIMEKLFDDYEGNMHYYWSPAQTSASFFDTKEKAIEEILVKIEQ